MAKVRKEDKLPLRMKQLGKIYRLIEQFEEISRIDLSKLSQLAPATITSLTRELIEKKLVIERAVQNTENRGRPAVGLCVSPFYWQSLCATLTYDHFDILLCELDGTTIAQEVYPLDLSDLSSLEQMLPCYFEDFLSKVGTKLSRPITFSIAVAGKLHHLSSFLQRLGEIELNVDLTSLFAGYFDIPIIVTEYFETWLLAESTLGSVIGYDDVIFLQIDEVINLSVLSKGVILQSDHKTCMNIDQITVPRLYPMQDKINQHLFELERYQIHNQLTYKAFCQFIDLYYPNNNLISTTEKINFLCKKAQLQDPLALEILANIADIIAYILSNLVNLFSPEKIMFTSRLLSVKHVFLNQINQRLAHYLHNSKICEVMTSQYEWNSHEVIAAAIKQKIYDGSLLVYMEKY